MPDDPKVEIIDARPVKLDLASGQKPKDGFRGVDLFCGDERVDLLSFPWPWADASVDEIHCSHFIEHIPMTFVDADGHHVMPGAGRVDALLRFFDEVYRVLKPGALGTFVWPACKSSRAFQDPTHRRFIPEEFAFYLSAEWRKGNGLDHYLGACDFKVNLVRVVDPIEGARVPEVLGDRMRGRWDVVSDYIMELRKA